MIRCQWNFVEYPSDCTKKDTIRLLWNLFTHTAPSSSLSLLQPVSLEMMLPALCSPLLSDVLVSPVSWYVAAAAAFINDRWRTNWRFDHVCYS